MKKSLFLFTLLLVAVMAFAAKEDNYLLYANFEDGSLPNGWTQENIAGEQMWFVESGATAVNPSGAYNGSNYRLAIRNQNKQTQYFTTRVITPTMDLRNVVKPIMVFSHAQPQWTGDVDELRIYYRSSPTGNWVLLEEYTENISTWRVDTVMLTAVTDTYQLAFEMTDKLGRGVVLDDIIIRPMPTCIEPANISTNTLTINSAGFKWQGSFDTDSFNVVISETKLTDYEDLTGVVINTTIEDFAYTTDTILKQNTPYYLYLRANCLSEVSEWVEFPFVTKNVIALPYVENFDKRYSANTYGRTDYWSYGTSILNDGEQAFLPFINQGTTNWINYSYTGTSCLTFAGANDCETEIPANHYVYAATPELGVESLSTVEVEFWGTVYNFVSNDCASSLIVGVMTDPVNFSTFVPVDTVTITRNKIFDRFTIHFDSYKGNGKFIGFVSNFSKKNIFFMDNLTIRSAQAKMPSDVQISNISHSGFDVNANLNGATGYTIYVTKIIKEKDGTIALDPTKFESTDYIISPINGTTLPATISLPSTMTDQFVEVYMVGTKGSEISAATLPAKVIIPTRFDGNSYFAGFESDEASWRSSDLIDLSNSTEVINYPVGILTMCSDNNVWPKKVTMAYNSNSAICLSKELQQYASGEIRYRQPYGDYIALPEVEDLKDVMLQFFMNGYSTSSQKAQSSKVAVGVMTNPLDPSTFEAITYCENAEDDYIPFIVKFDNYKGNGHYPAIMAVDATHRYNYASVTENNPYAIYKTSIQNIDAITLQKNSDCVMATNLNATATDATVTINWNGNGGTKWETKIFSDEACQNMVTSATSQIASCQITNLNPHTSYWYKVVTICSEGSTLESQVATFVTTCSSSEKIPYVEDFEAYLGGETSGEQPYCWNVFEKLSGKNTYPFITNTKSFVKSGNNAYALLYAENTTNGYFSLPKMSESLDKLQITFFMRVSGSNYGDTIVVGIMTDPQNLNTFEPIATIRAKSNTYEEHIVRFNHAKATNGYITFMKYRANANTGFYIDDICVDYCSACEKVQDVTVNNFTINGGTVSWAKEDATQWEVVLASKNVTLGDEVVADGADIISTNITTTMPYVISNCPKANATYYVYVRSLCSATAKGAWSNVVSFKTTCEALSIEDNMLIDFSDATELDCWTVGVRTGATASNLPKITSGALYMYDTKTTDGAYAIMPPLDVDDISKYQISFLAHGSTNATYLKKLKVGIITNVEDFATFSEMATVDLNTVSAATAWGEAIRYTVRFDKYNGDYNNEYGKQVIFYSESGSAANYIYIDNITFDTLASCQAPTNIRVQDVDHNSAYISWENIANKYQLQILNSKNQVEKDTLLTTSTYTTTDLLSLQTYVAQVRTICGVGDTSEWMQSTRFTTTCPPVFPLPYSEGFNYTVNARSNIWALPSCWNVWYNKLDGLTQTYAHVVATTVKDGIGSLNMASTYSATAPKSTIAVLPRLEGNIGDLMVSFDCYGIATYNATIAIGATNEHDDINAIMADIEWIDTISLAVGTAWNHYTTTLENYKGDAKYLVIAAINGNGKNVVVAQVYMDNLLIEKLPTCKRPTDIKTTTATSTTATMVWKPAGSETMWEVAFGPTNTPVENMTNVSTSKPSIDLTGLTSNTTYDVYVRAKCSATEESEWAGPSILQTFCVVDADELSWDFDNTNNVPISYFNNTLFTIPQCWYSSNKTSIDLSDYVPMVMPNTSRVSTNVLYGYNGSSKSLLLHTKPGNNGAYAVLPEMNVNMDTMQLHFMASAANVNSVSAGTRYVAYAGDGYAHSIKVGYMTDPYDYSTFVEIADFEFPALTSTATNGDLNAHWNEYVVSLYGAKGKFIAFASDYSLENYAYIDNVSVEKESDKPVPTNLTIDANSLTDSHAQISWLSSQSKWRVILMKNEATVATELIEKNTIEFNELTPNTEYTVKVQAICKNGDSDWAIANFTTRCAPAIVGGASWDFEENLYQYGESEKYLIPSCWKVGSTLETATQQYMPYAIANTETITYAHSNHSIGQHALQFYSTITAYGGYAIMPPVSVDPDSTELHFYYRTTYVQNNQMIANANYDKNLIVGYVINEDINTFVPVDTVIYTFVTTTADAPADAADDWWQEAILPMKPYISTGRSIAFKYCDSQPKFAGRYYIDDIEVRPLTVCRNLSGLRSTDIQSHAANITWDFVENDILQLVIAADADFENILVDTTLSANETNYQISNLNSGSTYYLKGRRFCSEEEVTDWVIANFTTIYEPRFAEDFSADVNIPLGWSVYAGSIEAALNKTGVMTSTTSEHAFARDAQRGDIRVYTGEQLGAISMTEAYWLNSPKIDLTNYKGDSLLLSFDVYLTNKDGNAPNEPSASDKFAVAISTDGGATWERPNATIWSSDASATHPYTDITGTPTKICLDITPTAGNIIVIGFSHYAYVTYSHNYLHIDNVQLNTCHIQEYTRDICQWNDYADDVLFVPAEQLTLGENHIEKYVPAKKNGEADNYYKATLNVHPIATTNQTATICQGEDYMLDGFNITNAISSNTYKQKLDACNSCDSVVTLNLVVLPISRNIIETSICKGNYYEFNGKRYYNTTTVVDTLKTSLGCDSICSLYLTVNEEAYRGEQETVYLCEGDSYDFHKFSHITEAGIYTDTIATTEGCDSIVSVEIRKADTYNIYLRAAICQGDKYNEGAFNSLSVAQDYPYEGKSVYGCDSLVTLHLLVADPETMAIRDQINANQLPYVLNGEELLPIGTAEGTYTMSVTLPCGQATITIIVGQGSGLDNINGKAANIRKVVVDDKVFIIVNDTWYDVLGNKVEAQR